MLEGLCGLDAANQSSKRAQNSGLGAIGNQPGRRGAGIGSGPGGLAGAKHLARMGHQVSVFEKSDRLGGLLTYGIPDFKLEPEIVDRRVVQMKEEGVDFYTDTCVGLDISTEELQASFDAVLLAGGAEFARELPEDIEGRELKGIHMAMEFLTQQNRRGLGDIILPNEAILATDKQVVILGGGDTGADCLGTSHRQGPAGVHQYEILPKPRVLRSGSSHEEGGERRWSVLTKGFRGENGKVRELHGVEVEWIPPESSQGNGGRPTMREIPGTEFTQPVELVLLAMGFLGPTRSGLLAQLGVALNERGAVGRDENFMTSVPGVFVAGDMTRGASLVVWAIAEGREAADGIHRYLMRDA